MTSCVLYIPYMTCYTVAGHRTVGAAYEGLCCGGSRYTTLQQYLIATSDLQRLQCVTSNVITTTDVLPCEKAGCLSRYTQQDTKSAKRDSKSNIVQFGDLLCTRTA